jgi:hypothetical protein
MKKSLLSFFVLASTLALLTSCSGKSKVEHTYPKSKDELETERMGRLTGEDGIVLFGNKSRRSPGSNGIGVNSYLWRATLDTVYTMPLLSADPFGGTIITDWQSLKGNPNERFKLNIVIIGSELRPDGVKVSAFKQVRKGNSWEEAKVSNGLSQEIEEKIISRARKMRYNK